MAGVDSEGEKRALEQVVRAIVRARAEAGLVMGRSEPVEGDDCMEH